MRGFSFAEAPAFVASERFARWILPPGFAGGFRRRTLPAALSVVAAATARSSTAWLLALFIGTIGIARGVTLVRSRIPAAAVGGSTSAMGFFAIAAMDLAIAATLRSLLVVAMFISALLVAATPFATAAVFAAATLFIASAPFATAAMLIAATAEFAIAAMLIAATAEFAIATMLVAATAEFAIAVVIALRTMC